MVVVEAYEALEALLVCATAFGKQLVRVCNRDWSDLEVVAELELNEVRREAKAAPEVLLRVQFVLLWKSQRMIMALGLNLKYYLEF